MRPTIDVEQYDRYLKLGGIYARILAEASDIVRCDSDKTAKLLRPKEYAIRRRYMRMNSPVRKAWLQFDLDHTNAMIWRSAGLPEPNIIVRDPATGKAHLTYAIVPVFTSDKARRKPQQYLEAIRDAYVLKLQADASYRGPVTKTPGHADWETVVLHERIYELGELAEYVELKFKNRSRKTEEQKHSRHCILFDELRFFAYDIVDRERNDGSYSRFVRLLEAFADEHNTFKSRGFPAGDLTDAEVGCTVRSVARWTWDNFTGSRRCRRGIMHLSDDLSLDEKQRRAAVRTHEVRRQTTGARILAACQLLRQKSEALTMTAVAKAAGLARQTVAKHRELLAADLPGTAVPPASVPPASDRTGTPPHTAPAPSVVDTAAASASMAADSVSFGVRQIYGALAGCGGSPPGVVELQADDG